MKKGRLLVYTLLLFGLVGCIKQADENALVMGNEFYSGSSKENLEHDLENNKPAKLEVASESQYFSSSLVKIKDEDALHHYVQVRDYLQKKDYKGHPRYDLIERHVAGDKIYDVISVSHGEYIYLISLNLLSDANINLKKEDSLNSAAIFYENKVKTTEDNVSTDYYYEVLRKIEGLE